MMHKVNAKEKKDSKCADFFFTISWIFAVVTLNI